MSRMRTFVAAAAAAASLGGPAAAAVIFSEDFSGGTPGTHGGGPLAGVLFTVTEANVDILGTLNGSFFSCVNGDGNCMDLVGNSGAGAVQSTTTFDLVAGQAYTLTFDEVLQGFNPGDPATTTVRVSLGSLFQDLVFAGGVATPVVVNFLAVAGEAGVQLGFRTLAAPDAGHGAVIDNVVLSTVSASVPEPGAWALMIMGFGAAGAALRRRRPFVTA